MRIRWPVVLAVIIGAVAWSIVAHPWGWLYGFGVHPYPKSSSTPWTYQLWSGLIPALTVLTLLGSIASLYRLHCCHQDHCWRIGRHKIGGSPWCDRHHQSARPEQTTDDLLRDLCGRLDTLAAELRESRTAPKATANRSRRAPAS